MTVEIIAAPSTTLDITELGTGTVEVLEVAGQALVEVTAHAGDVVEVLSTPVDTQVVEIATAGPQGPPGPAGADGAQAGSAEFNFAIASDQWVAVHNLGYPPAVMLYDSVGKQIGGVVTENTAVRTVVSYYFPVAGRMTLS